jgi:hypothetical protein
VVSRVRFTSERVRTDSGYHVERELVQGDTHFVVVHPSGNRLYWFSDPFSAEAEARRLRTSLTEPLDRLDL